ncbi:MAG: hypothetical protein ACM31K_07700 [Solirubrobacterales bacterium]
MPAPVRGSFGLLAAVLLATGTALAFDADISPWDLHSETSVIFGFIYTAVPAYSGALAFYFLLVRDETPLR